MRSTALALLLVAACGDGAPTDGGPPDGVTPTDAAMALDAASGDGAPSPRGDVLFHSDWSTATGNSDAALRDTSQVVPWSERWGENGLLAVVPATGLGFPPTMANVYRVAHDMQSFDWLMAQDRWSVPALGGSLYFRVYFRNDVADSVDAAEAYASTHPLESTGMQGGLTGNAYALHYGSYADGSFPFFFAVDGAPFPESGWTPGAPTSTHGGRSTDPATLLKRATYRLEWKLTRVAPDHYDLDLRVHDAAGSLLFDRSSFYAWGGSGQTLATDGGALPIDDARVTGLRIGVNGGFATSGPEYVYWGGFAVCGSDWCGPYATF